MNFKQVNESLIGKTVAWNSQSRGTAKKKTGEVVAIVPGGTRPSQLQLVKSEKYRTYNSMPYPGLSRDHDTVLVNVNGDLYWPLISKIEVVE